MICRSNQWTGFCVTETPVIERVNRWGLRLGYTHAIFENKSIEIQINEIKQMKTTKFSHQVFEMQRTISS